MSGNVIFELGLDGKQWRLFLCESGGATESGRLKGNTDPERERERADGAGIKHPSPLRDVLTGRKRPPREEGGRGGGGNRRVRTGG